MFLKKEAKCYHIADFKEILPPVNRVVDLAVREDILLAVTEDGTVQEYRFSNQKVNALKIKDGIKVVSGGGHDCLIHRDQTVSCRGFNAAGQIGQTTKRCDQDDCKDFLKVAGLKSVFALKLGERYSCAESMDGNIYCWGQNHLGQLGDGTTESRHIPKEVIFPLSTE